MDSQKECLFICSQSADPYSILLLDPLSGSSQWAFRGSELQTGKIQIADFLGDEQRVLCIALADKPVIITVPLKQHKKTQNRTAFCTKSILNQCAKFLVSHPTGDFVFIASDNKISTWEVKHGQMLSVVEEHIREISALKISTCGNFLATGSLDGALKIFSVASLIAHRDLAATSIRPLGGHSSHSLPVTDLFISNGTNPRILSVSNDQSACLYSLALRQTLIRITMDQALTACCMDPAETRIFIGSVGGQIRVVDILTEFKSNYYRMKPQNDGQTQFEHHNASVQKLCVNFDGTRLASGDQNGAYCIWDCLNGQCLRSGKMNGPIASLVFVFKCTRNGEDICDGLTANQQNAPPLVSSLQRQMPSKPVLKVTKHSKAHGENVENLDAYFNSLLMDVNRKALQGGPNESPETTKDHNYQIQIGKKRRLASSSNETVVSNGNSNPPTAIQSAATLMENEELKQRITEVERELERVVQINKEIYNFAANLVIDEEAGSG